MDGKYSCYVWEDGKKVIRDFKIGSRPSNFAGLVTDGRTEATQDMPPEKAAEAKEWNEMTIAQRIKSKVLG